MVRAGLILCLLAILTGPFYSESGYSQVSHSISELAAQNTDNAWVMRIGLLALGGSAIFGFLKQPNRLNISFLIFGICIAMSAVFSHKPFMENRPYSALLDNLHTLFASLGGLASVMGFIMLGINVKSITRKGLYFFIAAAYTLLPVLMFNLPAYQGIFQRLIFASFILWAWFEYPRPLTTATVKY